MTPLLSKSTTHLQLRLPEGGAFKVVNIMTGKTVALVTAETPAELGLVFQAFNELFRAANLANTYEQQNTLMLARLRGEDTSTPREWITVGKAAELRGVSRATVYGWIRRGAVASKRLPNNRLAVDKNTLSLNGNAPKRFQS